MKSQLIAVPSAVPGGLDAEMSMHFGHCDVYTLVTVEDGAVTNVSILPNPPHQEGGCLAPVQTLADRGVNALLAGGMGMRPLMGFKQVGIATYFAGGQSTVGGAVRAFLAGSLPSFSDDFTCKGSGHCHH